MVTKPLKTITQRTYELIADAVNCTGTFDPNEIFCIFEERLYIDTDTDMLIAFLQWVHDDVNNRRFGRANVNERFRQFKKTLT